MATKTGKVKKPGKVLSTLILPESNEIAQAKVNAKNHLIHREKRQMGKLRSA